MKSKPILDKVSLVIETSSPEQKEIVERYVSLANRQLHKATGPELWGVIGASISIERKFRKKFGFFIPRSKPIFKLLTSKEIKK